MDMWNRFRTELWTINPTGDPNDAFDVLQFSLSFVKDIDNNKVSFDLIVERYKEYCDYIDSRNMGREKKFYTKKADLVKYLNDKMFLQDFKASDKNSYLDFYFYGETSS